MPCHDHREAEEREHDRERLDRVTRYLCAVLRHLERVGLADTVLRQGALQADGIADGEIRDWWAGHKAADAR